MSQSFRSKYDLTFLDGWKKATALSNMFGLVDDYFTQAVRFNATPKGWEATYVDGTLYLKPPEKIRDMIQSGYTAVKISSDDDISQYDYTFKVGKMTTIGFWK